MTFANLTEPQKAAVDHFEGPLMVLAGPGSGKTRVITYRIARLLQRGVKPQEVLALTFTNKAAREMSARVHTLLKDVHIQVSTFHSFCARLLRRFPEHVGLESNFTILDSGDQVALVRKIMKDMNLDTMALEPRRVLNRISKARNDLISAEQFRRAFEESVGDPIEAVVYEVFPEYEQQVKSQNSVDFDALLLHVLEILRDNEEMRKFLDEQFRFVLVDEYQDTNLAQYKIVQGLSQVFPNLCATGDPDQSIYGWRGARPANISQFENDFPTTKVVSLDQNFRSTAAIVRTADQLISNNVRRHRDSLFTENPAGEKPQHRVYANAESEANQIAAEIAERVAEGKRKFSDFAIFYRVNALSRPLETALSRHQVPYQVAAGYSFYERAEIRDLVGYLRLIENPSDNAACRRIINRPNRGIGDKTLMRLESHAETSQCSLLKAAANAEEVPTLNSRSRSCLSAFANLLETLQHRSQTCSIPDLIRSVIEEIDYFRLWQDEFEEVDQDRAGNVAELVNAATIYQDSLADTDEEASLQDFLQLVSLTSEADSVDSEKGSVTLMTMHAAKGLEFPVVYIVGVENGLIPHERATQNGDSASFEEERRLLFVGVTRAMEELNLTRTRERVFQGSRRSTIASPFVGEMPELEFVTEDGLPVVPTAGFSSENEFVEKARLRYEAAQQRLTETPSIMSAADLERQMQAVESDDQTSDEVNAPSTALDAARDALNALTARKTGKAPQFEVGRNVRHPRYGRGTVVDASTGSSRATVTVLFENDDREETFVAAHCPLQPLN